MRSPEDREDGSGARVASVEGLAPEARRLRELTPRQWKSGIAAWLGWLFDGLDMHLYTLVAAPFVAQLLMVVSHSDGEVKAKSSWPRRWRPWIAAVLQTGVNLGVLLACLTVFLMAGWMGEAYNPRWVFLVGVLPALLVYWIRRHVPETEEWTAARDVAHHRSPPIRELFQGSVRPITLRVLIVCACSLTAWWAFMFWNQQHLRNLPELESWTTQRREQLVSTMFFMVISASIAGNFFAAWLARQFGYRRAIALLFIGFFLSMLGTYAVPRAVGSLRLWLPWIGFFSGVFGLFTMYLPPLFPILLRTTGSGFCYNFGRIAAAAGTVFFGLFSQVGDFRHALWYAGFLFIPAMLVAMTLPDRNDAKS
jgi:MFS family permease